MMVVAFVFFLLVMNAVQPSSVEEGKRVKRSLWNFNSIIRCELGTWIFTYVPYGCYCGFGGSGTPVDGIDECCKKHDECYGAATPVCGSVGIYTDNFKWSCELKNREKTAVCRGKTACEMALCQCDVDIVRCWSKYPRPTYKKKCLN